MNLPESIGETIQAWWDAIVAQVSSPVFTWQIGVVLVVAISSYLLSRYPVQRLRATADARDQQDIVYRLISSLARVVWPIFAVLLLWVATAVFAANGLDNHLLRISASLLNAWIVVRVITSNMKGGFWSSALAFFIWMVAALYILRLLAPVSDSLEAVSFTAAGMEFSLLRILTSAVIAVVAVWIGRVAGDAAQSQLRASKSLTPSMAGLLGQVIKIALMVLAIMIALNSLGVNLAALTVISGAIGIGIGFGLQAIFSNFISGIIILLEKSITVGDFIELQSGVVGEVREINIRSALITTNDNVDILVPNEEFIKSQVINWTLKESLRRLRVSFGLAEGTDKEVVRKAGLEAAAAVGWTYDDGGSRAPQVWLVGFGDSSLDYELVVWLNEEAVKKPAKVGADYNWALHTALEKYDLEIPFPQRDLHIRTSTDPIRVKMDPPDET